MINIEKLLTMKKRLLFTTVSLILLVGGCNSNTANSAGSMVETKSVIKGAEPVPQSGGFSNIDNAKLQELLDQGVTLIDIRLEEEWQQTGIVKGSKTITFFDHMGRINPNFVPQFTSIADPEKPVMLICRTGNRTTAASQAIAQQLGYKKVLNVTHGIVGWISEKRSIVSYK